MIVPQECGAVRGSPLRENEQEEGKGIMTPLRKTTPGPTRRKRTHSASAAPVVGTNARTLVDDALIAASGVDARSILIVTRDQAGALRVWSSTGDMSENLRLAEYARGELTVCALCAAQDE